MTKIPVLDIDRERSDQQIETAGFWESLGDFFSNISIQFGASQPPAPPPVETKEEKDNTMLYIMLGFAALVVLVLFLK